MYNSFFFFAYNLKVLVKALFSELLNCASFFSTPFSEVGGGGGLIAKFCPILCNPTDCSLPGSSVHGYFPGKSTGVGCHFLFQRIFPTQGSNLHLLLHRFFTPEPPGKPSVRLCHTLTVMLDLSTCSFNSGVT